MMHFNMGILLILLGKWSPEPNVSHVAVCCAALDLEMWTLHGQSERDWQTSILCKRSNHSSEMNPCPNCKIYAQRMCIWRYRSIGFHSFLGRFGSRVRRNSDTNSVDAHCIPLHRLLNARDAAMLHHDATRTQQNLIQMLKRRIAFQPTAIRSALLVNIPVNCTTSHVNFPTSRGSNVSCWYLSYVLLFQLWFHGRLRVRLHSSNSRMERLVHLICLCCLSLSNAVRQWRQWPNPGFLDL